MASGDTKVRQPLGVKVDSLGEGPAIKLYGCSHVVHAWSNFFPVAVEIQVSNDQDTWFVHGTVEDTDSQMNAKYSIVNEPWAYMRYNVTTAGIPAADLIYMWVSSA